MRREKVNRESQSPDSQRAGLVASRVEEWILICTFTVIYFYSLPRLAGKGYFASERSLRLRLPFRR